MNGPISKLAHCAIYIHCPPLAFPLASEMDRRPEPRTRSRQTKLRRGSGSPFCLVEQSYSVCGARDERTHAGQQQQLVDQLGHDVLPRNGSGKTTTGSMNFGSATACGPLGFIALMRAAGEQVASWASGAFVFKTLSTTGASNMAKAADYPVKPVMLVAGDDAREESSCTDWSKADLPRAFGAYRSDQFDRNRT
jgi:hypothetical protein